MERKRVSSRVAAYDRGTEKMRWEAGGGLCLDASQEGSPDRVARWSLLGALDWKWGKMSPQGQRFDFFRHNDTVGRFTSSAIFGFIVRRKGLLQRVEGVSIEDSR